MEEGGAPMGSRRAVIAAEQATEVFAELLSGDFDKEREEAEEAAAEEGGVYKRVLLPEPGFLQAVREATKAGLDWLARHQGGDGLWSASRNGISSAWARRRPTLDLPTPIKPTSTIVRWRRGSIEAA